MNLYKQKDFEKRNGRKERGKGQTMLVITLFPAILPLSLSKKGPFFLST